MMGEYSKVVWAEGTYLSPQHFQQNDRYAESNIHNIVRLNGAHYYGFFDLGINESLLKQGVVGLYRLEMVFEDGTVFIPTPDEIDSLKFSIPASLAETKLYLVISRVTASSNEISFDSDNIKNTRYSAFEKPLVDTTDNHSEPRVVTLARLNVRLMLEDDIHSSLVKIPIAIISSNENSEVNIQDSYIPPTLIAQNNPKLYNYMNELYGLLAQKSKSLANAVNDPNRGGSLEITDFLMLQTVNRYLAYMQHQKQPTNRIHPEALFVSLSKLCGDLMTFLPSRKMGDMPVYDHRNLKDCYQHLMSNLRISLSTILEQRIIRIDLSKKDSATYVAQTPNAEILEFADFVLAVKADMPNETLRHNLPSIMKISTVEQIKELVAYHLPGIKLNALSVAPRELPYHNGYVYFELDKQTELWERFDDSSGMAFHIAGDFPNIDLEFWAIKPNVN
jgi:type VI secretion system protein ImpJ